MAYIVFLISDKNHINLDVVFATNIRTLMNANHTSNTSIPYKTKQAKAKQDMIIF